MLFYCHKPTIILNFSKDSTLLSAKGKDAFPRLNPDYAVGNLLRLETTSKYTAPLCF